MNTSSSKAQQKNGKQNGKQSGLRRMIIKLSRKLTLIVTWRPRARVSQLLAMLLAATSTSALALPSGEQVVSGNISVARPDSASMTVTQTTDKGIINWNSYGIGAGEAVSYLQPSASSVTLNRVVGGDASQIFGQLSANGQLFLINPNGVLFAPGAQVDVGGLVASTLGIGDEDFLAGRYTFQNAGSAGSVVNQGSLSGKYIALIAPNIDNSGSIHANVGTAALAAGDRVSLDLSGDGLLQVSVDAAATGASIKHSGAIVADGGKVFITAKSADALMDTVLNVSGLVRAQSLSEVNGVIRLEGGNTGVVSVSGTLDVSGNKLGATGGSIAVLGDKVGLFDGARLDASGDAGGGTVLVGGNFQGQGPEQNANMTYVAAGASIDASATGNGNGGTVIVFASDTARIHGSLSARGGYLGGDGGFIETSGKRGFEISATPDVAATYGFGGTWLIDPNNIAIVAGGGVTNINALSPFISTDDTALLGVDLIIAALTGGATVTVTTGSGGAGLQDGNITLSTNLNFNSTGTNTLTLSAHNDIILDGSISDGTPGLDVLNLILTANSDSTGTGSVLINNTLNTGGGSLTASGVSITATGQVTAAATNLTASTGDISFSNVGNDFTGAVSSSAANVTLVDANAIDLGAGTISGNLTLTTAGAITDSGVLSITGTTSLTAGAGNNITLDAANNFGGAVSVVSGNNVTLNDTGSIDLGASTISGNLSVTATAGSITDSGDLTVTGNSTFAANTLGSSITLDRAGNAFTGSVAFASSGGLANVTIVDTTALDLQALTLSGNLSVTAAGITDSGALSIGGTTSLTAGSLNITLDDANNFGGAVSVVSGNNVILNDTNAIALGNITTTGGLTVTAVGNIDAYGTGGVLTIGGDLNATSTGGFGWFDYYTGSGHDYQGDVNITALTSVYVWDKNNLELGRIQSTNSIVWIAANGKITGDTSLLGGCGVAGIFACGADIRVSPTQSIYLNSYGTSGSGGIGDGAFNGVSFDVASLQKAIHVDVVGASDTAVPSLIYLSAPEGSKTFLTVNTQAQTTSLTTPAPASGTGPIRVAIPQRDAGGNIIGTSTVPPASGMNLCHLSTAQCINLFDLSEVAGSFDISGILNAAFQDAFNAQFGTDNIRVAIQNGFLTEFGVVPPGIDGIDGDGVNVPGASQALVIDTPPFLIDEEGLKRRSLPK